MAVVGVAGHGPVARAAADVRDEAREERLALPRVRDLGVKLHAVEAARFVHHGRDRRRVVARHDREAGRQRRDLVAVAHPHVEQAVALRVAPVLDAVEQAAVSRARAPRRSRTRAPGRFPPRRPAARPSSACRSRCRAPARPRSNTASGRARRVALGHALRAAGQDDPGGREISDERVAHVERVNLAVDVELAHAPRDELRVLRAEIEDQDPAGHGGRSVRRHGATRWTAKCRRARTKATACRAALRKR